MYGDEIYKQNVDTLYGLGHLFAEKIKKRKSIELALEPLTNIVCFRYKPKNGDLAKVNQEICERLLRDGSYYVVSTRIHGVFYLRVTIMNPLTDEPILDELLDKIEQTGMEIESTQH